MSLKERRLKALEKQNMANLQIEEEDVLSEISFSDEDDIMIVDDDLNVKPHKEIKNKINKAIDKLKTKKKQYNDKYYGKNKNTIANNNKETTKCKICDINLKKGSLNLHNKSMSHRLNKLEHKFDKFLKSQ